MFFLSKCSPISFVLAPSMKTSPSYSPRSLNKTLKIEDFPDPVLPTIPTFIPGLTLKFNCFIAD